MFETVASHCVSLCLALQRHGRALYVGQQPLLPNSVHIFNVHLSVHYAIMCDHMTAFQVLSMLQVRSAIINPRQSCLCIIIVLL